MRCPFCEYASLKVVDKRKHSHDSIRRRRECLKCSRRFTTYERPEIVSLRVVKKNGERESFDRDKLLRGMLKSFEKRPVTTDEINKAVHDIENELRSNDLQEVNSQVIGEMVMKKIQELDKVAYVRFASVYKDFTDLKSFEDLVKNLKKGGK